MDRTAVLVRLSRRLLEKFSARTVRALGAALPMRVVLPHLEPFLARNLEKEVRKDARVIRCAGEALAANALPDAGAARRLLEEARDVDREFLASIGWFPIRIQIPYSRIEPLRLQRIELGLDLARRILGAWREGHRLRDELSREELERRLLAILNLYCEEVAVLSQALAFPVFLAPVRDRFSLLLLGTMRETAARLAKERPKPRRKPHSW
jgi:hypothetical protein